MVLHIQAMSSAGVSVLQSHPKFSSVEDLQPLLYSRALQKDTSKQPEAMSLKAAVSQRVIANETLAYFIGRTYLFLVRLSLLDAWVALSLLSFALYLAVTWLAYSTVKSPRQLAMGIFCKFEPIACSL